MNAGVIRLNPIERFFEVSTENPYQPSDSIAKPTRVRISLVSAIWILVFLLIFGFFAYESARQILFGNAAIAVNLCVFYLPILTAFAWYLRKRILGDLAACRKNAHSEST